MEVCTYVNSGSRPVTPDEGELFELERQQFQTEVKDECRKKHPVALLSFIGGSKSSFLPNETVKNQLKSGLRKIIGTAHFVIITEGRYTGVGNVAEEVNRGKKKFDIFHYSEDALTCFSSAMRKEHKKNHPEDSVCQLFIDRDELERSIIDSTNIPLIMILIGGDEDSFEDAMSSLKKNVHVIAMDGSGGAADFICKGYTISMHSKGEKQSVFPGSFKFDMMEAAANIWGYEDQHDTTVTKRYEKCTDQLLEALEQYRKFVKVHSVNDTAYTLDMTIQDILFKIYCDDGNTQENFKNRILCFVKQWNRPDIAEKKIFTLQNRNFLQDLQDELGKKDSDLAKLFLNSLVDNKIDFVIQVLDYIQNRELYTQFLDNYLEYLYLESKGKAGFLIHQQNKKEKMGIVKKINNAVTDILGSKASKPFKEDDKTDKIQKMDVFEHLFIWAVLVDRRELAMLFWRNKDRDFICSALYASALAKKLAENSSSDAYVVQKAALFESSSIYEDLAYNVMTNLYWHNRNCARQMLVTQVERYNLSTIFEITEKFTLMKFMGHAACQTKLNKIWKGRISSETSDLKIVTAAFIPVLIMNMVSIDTNVKSTNTISPSETTVTSRYEEKPNETSSQFASKCANSMRKIFYFYNSPLVKFLFSALTYISMLVIFCLFVLTDLYPMSEKTPSLKEYLVYLWAATAFTEELRQAIVIKQVSLNLTWFSFWTLFEIVMYSMFATSVVLRLTLSAENFYHSRMMYAITLGLFIINSMQYCLVSKHIGPKIIMIGRMMFDFLFFLLIIAVFLFGFGVIYQATMYPNSKPGFQLLNDIIYMPYWQLYGELFLDQFEGTESYACTNDVLLYRNGTLDRCPVVNQMNTVLLGVYMVVTHLILVNILIAMFAHTFTKIQDNNELVWKFHRYSLIQEYYNRSALIPPLIIISHLKRVILFIYHKCTRMDNNKFKIQSTHTDNLKLAYLEEDAVDSHLNATIRRRQHTIIEAGKDGFEAHRKPDLDHNVQEQFDLVMSKLDTVQERVSKEIQKRRQHKNIEAGKDGFKAHRKPDLDHNLQEQFDLVMSKLDTLQERISKEMKTNSTTSEQLPLKKNDSLKTLSNASVQLESSYGKTMEEDKDGFEASYKQDTELSLQDQFKIVLSKLDTLQANVSTVMQSTDTVSGKIAILEEDAVNRQIKSLARLERKHTRKSVHEKECFDDIYEQETDLRMQNQVSLLSSRLDEMQKKVIGSKHKRKLTTNRSMYKPA